MTHTIPVRVRGTTYHLPVTKGPDGFTAQCVELPAAISQGQTGAEALVNGRNAVRDVLAFEAGIRATLNAMNARMEKDPEKVAEMARENTRRLTGKDSL